MLDRDRLRPKSRLLASVLKSACESAQGVERGRVVKNPPLAYLKRLRFLTEPRAGECGHIGPPPDRRRHKCNARSTPTARDIGTCARHSGSSSQSHYVAGADPKRRTLTNDPYNANLGSLGRPRRKWRRQGRFGS